MTLEEEQEYYMGDDSWLGEHVGKKSKFIGYRVCSHCGKDIREGWVYDDGRAYYCSNRCLLQHFSEEEWNDYLERAESDECLELGLAYYAKFGE